MEEFIQQIMKNLSENGFPQKKVSLPTEKMYEVADKKGLSLNNVFDEMRSKMQITIEIETERIVFSMSQQTQDMFTQAAEMMQNMDPQQLEAMKKMFETMSEEEKEKLMAQAGQYFQGQ